MEEGPAKAKVPEAHKSRNESLEKRPCLVGQLPRATEMMRSQPTARFEARGSRSSEREDHKLFCAETLTPSDMDAWRQCPRR